MVSISVTATFRGEDDLGLDRVEQEATCPRCRLRTPFFLRDVRLGRVLVCKGCKANLQLNDYLGSYQEMRNRLRRQMRELLKTLSDLGR
ncbi:MAG: hypothetical protein EP329_25925 [Deltaproteobacteria bacterium]|nr:MAG: hypothetical protein EP329_25925 [Deltaproteobacteria bacterium]